ncbi:MAG: hypothetical protein DMG49_12225 [Acidobacteria bacterium]|nr:MAG: hypothetical protein DMG49_12225 [Acidobacteriota bacterium]
MTFSEQIRHPNDALRVQKEKPRGGLRLYLILAGLFVLIVLVWRGLRGGSVGSGPVFPSGPANPQGWV